MERKLYHKRWPEIREAVKERAGYCCEECGAQEGQILISKSSGKRYILYLHAAHLSGDPRDIRRCNLRCLCPSCHMRLDRSQEAKVRKTPRRRGYQITTTDRLIKAMHVAGLLITETDRGYAWEVDDLSGQATSAVNAVADAIYHLRGCV
jgi:hypothetical protein